MFSKNKIIMKQGGIFTISIDVELAWPESEKPIRPSIRRAIQLEREIIGRIIDLFSEYDIRATWAIVGHLLLQHPENQDDPLWYGPDIIEQIRNTLPKQEIGSHSFCHIIYDEEYTNAEEVRADIERAKKLHEASGLPFEAFVFPGNIVGYRKLLAKAGIRVYRGKSHRWYDYYIPCCHIRRLLNFLCFLMAIPPPTVTATVDETDMVNVPDSMFILDQVGIRSIVPSRNLINMGLAGLNRAVEQRKIFHLWFHPLSFTYRTDKHFRVLEAILRHAQCLRENGRLQILTMGDIQRRIKANHEG